MRVFPSLAKRPLLLTGESYAGTYIASTIFITTNQRDSVVDFVSLQPYITKALFSTEDPPVKLHKVAIGNGAMGAVDEAEELPIVGPRIFLHV